MDAAYKAWTHESVREKWLANPGILIRKATQNHTLQITWVDGVTSLDVFFYPKGDKVQVSLNHSKLSDPQKAEKMKKYWAEQLAKLAVLLE